MKTDIMTLAKQPFCEGLPEHLLKILAKEAMPVEFKAGEEIFNEGDPANRFYLIGTGSVELESSIDREYKPLVIETIGAGSVLGWSWLFPPYYWHFDACALTPVKAVFFYGTRLREKCETNNELGYELMKRINQVVIERLQATRHRLAEADTKLLLPI